MNLSLDHKDITTAIEAYVMNQGIQVTGKTLITTITCGRGANGTSATVELVDSNAIAAGPERGTVVPSNNPKINTAEPLNEEDSDEILDEPSAEALSMGGGLFDE